MNVNIKEFDVEMELKNRGIELDVYDNNENHRGDLIVTKTRLIWCPGKTHRENGHSVTWAEFIDYMVEQQ
jgi:hypothetical protein